MNVVITGGTGFVGKALTDNFLKDGHLVYILTRHPEGKPARKGVTYVEWLGENSEPEKHLHDIDAIVNLAGESLNSGRWTKKRKARILDSRMLATQKTVRLIKKLDQKPRVLVNASAIGIYGTSQEKTFTEQTNINGEDFLADVVQRWESEAVKAKKLGVRCVLARFGVILGQDGALPRMVLPYKLGIGGTVGSGAQWLSWVHISDVVGMIRFAIDHEKVTGSMNVTAPEPKQMKAFGQNIGSVLHRPHWLPVPGFVLKTLLGEMSMLVLQGQRVLPEKAEQHCYPFRFSNLDTALTDLFINQK